MPPSKKCTWSPRKMKMAVQEVKGGAKLRRTALQYGVPVMSLHDHVKKGPEFAPRLGNKTVFTAEQEAEIRDELLKLAAAFYGLTPADLRKAAFEYAEKNKIRHPFNKEKKEAGKDWFYGFLKRNPEISIRTPEATSISRITAFNATEMKLFFSNLTDIMERYHIPPHRMFNVDETGVTTVHKPGKILAKKGQKQVGAATSWERGKNITVCCCMSATGQFIPPLFIFPRLRMTPALERGGPSGSLYKCSKSGWMIEELFFVWLEHFVSYTKPSESEPVLLILDNHASHISLKIYEYCRQNNVLMLSIPPHTSHRTQPLDLTFFGPLKIAYHKECDLFMKSHCYEKLTPYDIAPLFTKAYLKTAVAEKAVNGFEAAGIWPINPDKFADLCDSPEEVPHSNIAPSIGNVLEAGPSTSRPDVLTHEPRIPEGPYLVIDSPTSYQDFVTNSPPETRATSETPSPSIFLLESTAIIEDNIIQDDKENSHLQHLQSSATPALVENKDDTIGENLIQNSQGHPHYSFAQCSPAPGPFTENKISKGKGRGKRSKQHSEILTSTPMKDILEAAALKKTLKNMKQEKNKLKKDAKKVVYTKTDTKKTIKSRKEAKSYKRKILDDDNDGAYYDEGLLGVSNEICAICGEFGKDNELWYRCITCAQWVHALCSDKDVPDGYICSFCKP